MKILFIIALCLINIALFADNCNSSNNYTQDDANSDIAKISVLVNNTNNLLTNTNNMLTGFGIVFSILAAGIALAEFINLKKMYSMQEKTNENISNITKLTKNLDKLEFDLEKMINNQNLELEKRINILNIFLNKYSGELYTILNKVAEKNEDKNAAQELLKNIHRLNLFSLDRITREQALFYFSENGDLNDIEHIEFLLQNDDKHIKVVAKRTIDKIKKGHLSDKGKTEKNE